MDPATTSDPYYHLIATVHGITGLIIFATGLSQFILKKGTRLHRITGRVYLYSWILIITTGAYIGSPIIVAIVFMGFYLSITGIRLAVRKNEPFALIDKSILVVAMFIVLFMICAAIVLAIKQNYIYATLAGFFALLYSFVLTLDISGYIFNKRLIGRKNGYGDHDWYVWHLSRMQFSFITAVGAFTAVQNLFGNTLVNFILPAFLGIIGVRISRRYFIKKLNLED